MDDEFMDQGFPGCLAVSFVLALQIALVVFKLFGLLEPWSWFVVFVPALILVGIALIAFGSVVILILLD